MFTTSHFVKNFSEERFRTYLDLTTDYTSALALYEYNIKLSESFYPSLHNLEIALRNNFHLALAKIYGEEWFLKRHLIKGSNRKESVNLSKIEEIIRKEKSTDAHVVISNLSFGFWVSLLYPNYELELWRPALRNIFPQEIKITRKEIHQKIEGIKLIRNRIAHHEFILKHDLKLHHQTIYKILNYLSTELTKWATTLDNFPKVFLEYQTFLTKLQTIKNPGDLQVEVDPGHT